MAQRRHTRATAGVELMRTPSRSNRRAAQRISVMSSVIVNHGDWQLWCALGTCEWQPEE